MAQTDAKVGKATHRLEDIEAREVSPVDRAANGKKWLIRKADGADATEEETMPKTATLKNGVPAPGEQPVAQAAAAPPPPPPAAGAAEEKKVEPGAEAAAPEGQSTLVLPTGAKASLVGGLKSVAERIANIVLMLEAATEADGVEMPGEPVVAIADAAGAMASCVEPYVAKVAGYGMMSDGAEAAAKGTPPPAEGEVETAKAFVPWTQEYIDSLRDYCFLFVEPGTERDNEWRTIPLANRKLPVRDHAGRLCLPMVLEAIAQISAGAEPFISAQRKRKLLLDLACERLYEASIAAYRDEPMQPETGSELAAVAEIIANVSAMTGAAPGTDAAAPAVDPAAAPAATDGTVQAAAPAVPQTEEQQMAATLAKCAARLNDLSTVSKAGAKISKANHAKLAEVSEALKAAHEKMCAFMGDIAKAPAAGEPAVVEDAAPPAAAGAAPAAQVQAAAPPAAPESTTKAVTEEAIAKAVAEKDAEVAKAKSEAAKAQRESADLRVALAKANADLRKPAPSGINRDEPKTEVGKSGGGAHVPPLRSNLNAVFEQTK